MKAIEEIVRFHGGVWPFSDASQAKYCCLTGKDYTIVTCTRTEFEECTRRLRNEPSFDNHPDAKCFVQNDDGGWYKNIEYSDVFSKPNGHWHHHGFWYGWKYVQKGEVIGDWKDSLRLRPEGKKVEDKNDWHKRGEFPPVGTVCRLRFATTADVVVTITYVGDGVLCYRDEKGMEYAAASDHVELLPLQTEREQLIEEAIYLIEDDDPKRGCVENVRYAIDLLARAGMLKMPEDK